MRNTTFGKWAGGGYTREPVSTNRSLSPQPSKPWSAIPTEKLPDGCKPEPMAVCQQASPENKFGVGGGVETKRYIARRGVRARHGEHAGEAKDGSPKESASNQSVRIRLTHTLTLSSPQELI